MRERTVERASGGELKSDLLAGVFHHLRQRRRRGMAHTLSLARDRLHGVLAEAIERHARGDCLDAGSGRSPYRRVRRPNGRLLLTAPHLSMIHEAPHDYFRYTQYGLRSRCQRAGLAVETIQPTGGLVCLLSHNASVVWMSTCGSLPGMMWPAWFVNYLLMVRIGAGLDRLMGLPSVYPCDCLVVARKPLFKETEQDR